MRVGVAVGLGFWRCAEVAVGVAFWSLLVGVLLLGRATVGAEPTGVGVACGIGLGC